MPRNAFQSKTAFTQMVSSQKTQIVNSRYPPAICHVHPISFLVSYLIAAITLTYQDYYNPMQTSQIYLTEVVLVSA